METLKKKINEIINIKNKIELIDNSLFTHYNIPNIPIYDNTISIVMTSSNRSKQIYFTLNTIKKCSFKNIQIIIVDDSDIDPIDKTILDNLQFNIDFIVIKKENKNWINPVINYNIGFKFIKGSKVVIQNGEVCHIGDVLGWISKYTFDNNYYVFDVKASSSLDNNEKIYNSENLTTEIYNKNIYNSWYQNRERCANYHFLTALTKNTFDLIKNFSYDYTFGVDWDDDDFLLKIKSKNINIINLFNEKYNMGGIHLYHKSSYLNWKNIENNNTIFNNKNNFYKSHGKYIDYIENLNINIDDIFYKKYIITDKTNLLELQEEIINSNNRNIHLVFNKRNFTKEMNSFRKCILKRYCYKNSNIKLSKNIKIKISFL
jgi:hypothetical protein